jgi:hypothetical protein
MNLYRIRNFISKAQAHKSACCANVVSMDIRRELTICLYTLHLNNAHHI